MATAKDSTPAERHVLGLPHWCDCLWGDEWRDRGGFWVWIVWPVLRKSRLQRSRWKRLYVYVRFATRTSAEHWDEPFDFSARR